MIRTTPLTRRAGLAALTSLPALAACSPSAALVELGLGGIEAATPRTGYRLHADLAFAPEARQRLDVYVPEPANGSLPVIVFWYGGGWRSGGRKQYRFVAESLTRQGFVVVLPDYRLAPEVAWPAFVQDGAAAVAWVAEQIGPLGGDARRLVLAGHSSGGHTALVLALDPRWLGQHGLDRDRIAGVVSIAGVTGFEPLNGPDWDPLFRDADPPGSFRPSRLVQLGAAQAPPLLLLAGAEDRLISPADTERLAAAIGTAGGTAEVVVEPGANHLSIVLGLSSAFSADQPIALEMAGFARRVMARS